MSKITAYFQKHLATIGLIVYGLLAIYALAMATPAAVLRLYTNQSDITDLSVPGYYAREVEGINNLILILSIAGLLVSLLYRFFRNDLRKIYYPTNFVLMGLWITLPLVTFISGLAGIIHYEQTYKVLDFATINNYFASHLPDTQASPDTPVFALGYLALILVLLLAVPGVLILIDRIKVRLANKPLLAEVAAVEATERASHE
jgi:hypothetical protein